MRERDVYIEPLFDDEYHERAMAHDAEQMPVYHTQHGELESYEIDQYGHVRPAAVHPGTYAHFGGYPHEAGAYPHAAPEAYTHGYAHGMHGEAAALAHGYAHGVPAAEAFTHGFPHTGEAEVEAFGHAYGHGYEHAPEAYAHAYGHGFAHEPAAHFPLPLVSDMHHDYAHLQAVDGEPVALEHGDMHHGGPHFDHKPGAHHEIYRAPTPFDMHPAMHDYLVPQ